MADAENTRPDEGRPIELLWPEGAPGALGEAEADKPTVTIFLPEHRQAAGPAIVILPGGGYVCCSMEKEGFKPARWFNERGMAAFVVRYRTNNTSGTGYKHPIPLQDARRAMRMVRSRAGEFAIDPERIGLVGFSAGGHLAASVATHFKNNIEDAKDDLAGAARIRPDFLILIYPVITMKEPFMHAGCRKALFGEYPPMRLLDKFSGERMVTDETPPTFLVSSWEDNSVPAENSVEFYLALRRWRVHAELHVYEKGPHGFGMNPGFGPASSWPDRLHDWLQARKLI